MTFQSELSWCCTPAWMDGASAGRFASKSAASLACVETAGMMRQIRNTIWSFDKAVALVRNIMTLSTDTNEYGIEVV